MIFSTKIPISKSIHPIDYSASILLIGSCFADKIGTKFNFYKFRTIVNPFGIIFNPISIENVLTRVVKKRYFTEQDIFFHNELWHCFEVHSEFSNSNKKELLSNLNSILDTVNGQISQLTHLIITYGSSWVYRNITTNQVVANCHKVSQNQFIKEILTVSVIEKSIENTIALIQKINPNCNFIFTVSPVRHLKDGFVENQRSKSHLITAIHNPKFTIHSYFPSYEIVMDELRDYRFYAEDMLHPNQIAIDYIWERFEAIAISKVSLDTMAEINNIQKAMAHRPFNFESESHLKFKQTILVKIREIQLKYPFMNF